MRLNNLVVLGMATLLLSAAYSRAEEKQDSKFMTGVGVGIGAAQVAAGGVLWHYEKGLRTSPNASFSERMMNVHQRGTIGVLRAHAVTSAIVPLTILSTESDNSSVAVATQMLGVQAFIEGMGQFRNEQVWSGEKISGGGRSWKPAEMKSKLVTLKKIRIANGALAVVPASLLAYEGYKAIGGPSNLRAINDTQDKGVTAIPGYFENQAPESQAGADQAK